MQSGVVAAEEGEMIASVRNLDSKKIKARTKQSKLLGSHVLKTNL